MNRLLVFAASASAMLWPATAEAKDLWHVWTNDEDGYAVFVDEASLQYGGAGAHNFDAWIVYLDPKKRDYIRYQAWTSCRKQPNNVRWFDLLRATTYFTDGSKASDSGHDRKKETKNGKHTGIAATVFFVCHSRSERRDREGSHYIDYSDRTLSEVTEIFQD